MESLRTFLELEGETKIDIDLNSVGVLVLDQTTESGTIVLDRTFALATALA